MKCLECGDGMLASQEKCPHCTVDPPDKRIELLQRDLGDAIKLLTKIRDMDYRGNRHSSQELAFAFLKERFGT